MRLVSRALAAAIAASALCLACSPAASTQGGIVAVFRDLGLMPLVPLRSYIEVGGLFVQAAGDERTYIDRLDPVAPEQGTVVDFAAIIPAEVRERTTRFGAALDLLRQVVQVPFGLHIDRTQEIRLSQVDAGGVRLRENGLEMLLAQAGTAGALRRHLAAGRRAFVVQEVYRSTSLSVAAATSVSLEATVNGTPVPSCRAGGLGAPNPGSDAGTAMSDTAPTPSLGVGVCFADGARSVLSFTSAAPLPFAVRLAEIELVDGAPRVKYTGFAVRRAAASRDPSATGAAGITPTGAAAADIERATAFMEGPPVIKELRRAKE